MSSAMQGTDEGVVEQAKSELGDAASAVQDKAVELQQQGRSKLGDALDERTTRAGGQSRQVAQVLRESGLQLRAQEGEDGCRSPVSPTRRPSGSSGSGSTSSA